MKLLTTNLSMNHKTLNNYSLMIGCLLGAGSVFIAPRVSAQTNLLPIGLHVHIGAHTAIAGCVGISGSTSIGRRCLIGGAVGIVGHLTIVDDVVITGLTMVSRSLTKPGVYSSALPAEEARLFRRNAARFRRLDEWYRRSTRGSAQAPLEFQPSQDDDKDSND